MHSQREGALKTPRLRSLFSRSAKEFLNAPPRAGPETTYVIMATKTGPHAVNTILPIA
jgi:hypothetical protein